MLTLYIQNIKIVKDIADYKYITMIDAEKIAEGKVKGHIRSDGWAVLVKKIAEKELRRK